MGKGARLREERKLAIENQEEMDKITAKIEDMQARHVVNNCSNAVYHEDGCDGNCGEHSLTQLQIELIEEQNKWREIGMDTLGIQVDPLHIEVALDALVEHLEEIGAIPDHNVLNEKFREKMLYRLRRVREANQDAIMAAQSRARIVPAGIDTMPQLVMPPQRRTRLH